MSLRWKIAAAMAVLAGTIVSLASFGAYVAASRQLASSIDDALVERANATFDRARMGGPQDRDEGGGGFPGRPAGFRRGCPTSAQLQGVFAAQLIIDETIVNCVEGGQELPVTSAERRIVDAESADDAGSYEVRSATIGDDEVRMITIQLAPSVGFQLARSTEEIDEVLESLGLKLIAMAAVGIVGAAIAGFALATRIVAPIRRLTSTAEHIAATRDLSAPIPEAGTDEIGSLTRSFSTMVASLSESRDQQQRLISDASHEMRTPLTSMRTNLELLARADNLPTEERREVIDDLQFETGELTALLTELVELATDQSAASEPREEADFAALCAGILERARRRTGRELVMQESPERDPGEPRLVEVRAHMIERAISNLVDNAIKYSPDATPIEVTTSGGRIEVRDHGAGIATEDLPRIFDRFYRATSARTEPGSGLGLAIVSQIVENHGGRVFASNHPDGGAIVGFELPVVIPEGSPADRTGSGPTAGPGLTPG